MQKPTVKYLITFLLLLIYINRGVFIIPHEIENQDNKEINSIIEWVAQLITGEDNGIDEDGDLQSDCNTVKIFGYNYYQEFAQYFDALSLYSKSLEKMAFPNKEDFYLNDFCSQIDHPPQMILNL